MNDEGGALPEWVFFDCFNTLLDEPDETGLATIEAMPVEHGFYSSVEAFRADYAVWCGRRWPSAGWGEVHLPERLCEVLGARDPKRRGEVGALVERMIETFEEAYPRSLCVAPGAVEMLEAWQGRARLGVVSNFFLPGLPETYLEQFGLARYFDFILDSADFGHKKPGTDIFHEALRRGRVSQPDRVLVVGDHLRNDVEAPSSLGMRALHFNRSGPRAEGAATIAAWAEFRPG